MLRTHSKKNGSSTHNSQFTFISRHVLFDNFYLPPSNFANQHFFFRNGSREPSSKIAHYFNGSLAQRNCWMVLRVKFLQKKMINETSSFTDERHQPKSLRRYHWGTINYKKLRLSSVWRDSDRVSQNFYISESSVGSLVDQAIVFVDGSNTFFLLFR